MQHKFYKIWGFTIQFLLLTGLQLFLGSSSPNVLTK